MIEARRAGEQPDAIASDRCVIASSSTKCSLYLAFGNYTIAAFDEQEKRIDNVARNVE